VRLNDFNRAEFMLWNEEKQEYCKYQNNPGHGDVRTGRKNEVDVSVVVYYAHESSFTSTFVPNHLVEGTGGVL
jgi:hypothetical protein